MSFINQNGGQLTDYYGVARPVKTPQIHPSVAPTVTVEETAQNSEDDVVDLPYIVTRKPKVSVVRDFLKTNICAIRADEDSLFS